VSLRMVGRPVIAVGTRIAGLRDVFRPLLVAQSPRSSDPRQASIRTLYGPSAGPVHGGFRRAGRCYLCGGMACTRVPWTAGLRGHESQSPRRGDDLRRLLRTELPTPLSEQVTRLLQMPAVCIAPGKPRSLPRSPRDDASGPIASVPQPQWHASSRSYLAVVPCPVRKDP